MHSPCLLWRATQWTTQISAICEDICLKLASSTSFTSTESAIMVSERPPCCCTKPYLLMVVLLGRSLDLEYISEYPKLKLCDWGLATPTSKRGHDTRNPQKFCGMDTRIWEPPEQRYGGEYFRKWRSRVAVRKGQRITSEHTTWQMTGVIFCIITVSRPQFEITGLDALTWNSWILITRSWMISSSTWTIKKAWRRTTTITWLTSTSKTTHKIERSGL
jgi:hypothetical protein